MYDFNCNYKILRLNSEIQLIQIPLGINEPTLKVNQPFPTLSRQAQVSL